MGVVDVRLLRCRNDDVNTIVLKPKQTNSTGCIIIIVTKTSTAARNMVVRHVVVMLQYDDEYLGPFSLLSVYLAPSLSSSSLALFLAKILSLLARSSTVFIIAFPSSSCTWTRKHAKPQAASTDTVPLSKDTVLHVEI